MRAMPIRPRLSLLIATLTLPLAGAALAQGQPQEQEPVKTNITVYGSQPVDPATLAAGPEIKGIISARNGQKIKVTAADGNSTVIALTEATRVKASSGLFGSKGRQDASALLNGLPVTVKTLQGDGGLVASQVTYRNTDFKTASMIRNGTAQQFEEQSAATEALRGRLGDIDKYNIKSTSNVYFDTGKYALSPAARADLCRVAQTAEATDNALMLVVGYTDSVGSDEYNQTLSEKRAGAVINYLQQACKWKPYRMLTPTGMAKADPQASNDTEEGKAQNRRVSINVLVSKSVDVE
ncbi:OmpA family protein [Novosphingobium flavum]|uniref:OmpA family protein n=1 Tax=Novosphingobium aerophilum TaxID=2839843 RepID=A0A7X1FA18_9SPHN|nr:OmpA family protein [Novosphingobium aerophilum]MBC2653162.1 OmpA family protein [Novosphingobium aerophilum]MBC2661533.1 OmpA family protein [Novosphingobium aerophilum]